MLAPERGDGGVILGAAALQVSCQLLPFDFFHPVLLTLVESWVQLSFPQLKTTLLELQNMETPVFNVGGFDLF